MTTIIFTARSSNSKTGPIPVTTSSSETCPLTCPFLRKGCYAKNGPLAGLWRKMTDAGPHTTFKSGIATVATTDWQGLLDRVRALAAGVLWRHNQAGDLPQHKGTIDAARVADLVEANTGKRGFTYTHHDALQNEANRATVEAANDGGFTINLSGNSLPHADALADLDIAPVVCVLPSTVEGNVHITTPKGRRVVVCPATYRDDTNCQSCGLCAVRDRKVIVGFPAHGAQKKAASAIAA